MRDLAAARGRQALGASRDFDLFAPPGAITKSGVCRICATRRTVAPPKVRRK
jgi:hypothetical protein